MSTGEQPERDVVHVVYLPYLPLRERITVGEWELMPRAALAEEDCVDARTIELAQGLGAVYVLPEQAGTAAGAFARSRERRVGDVIADMPDLQGARSATRVHGRRARRQPVPSLAGQRARSECWALDADLR